jgi:hypothetical protein
MKVKTKVKAGPGTYVRPRLFADTQPIQHSYWELSRDQGGLRFV